MHIFIMINAMSAMTANMEPNTSFRGVRPGLRCGFGLADLGLSQSSQSALNNRKSSKSMFNTFLYDMPKLLHFCKSAVTL